MTAYYSFKVIINKKIIPIPSLSSISFSLQLQLFLSLSSIFFFFTSLLLLSSSPKTQIFFSLLILSFVMVMGFVASHGCGYDGFCDWLWVWW